MAAGCMLVGLGIGSATAFAAWLSGAGALPAFGIYVAVGMFATLGSAAILAGRYSVEAATEKEHDCDDCPARLHAVRSAT